MAAGTATWAFFAGPLSGLNTDVEPARFSAIVDVAATEFAAELSEQGFQIRAVHDTAFNGVVGVGPGRDVDALARDPRVTAFDRLPYPAVFDVDTQPDVPIPAGAPVVYIVDTPADLAHDWFDVDHVATVNGFQQYHQNMDADSCSSHGTSVAGRVGGVHGYARHLTLVSVGVVCGGHTDTETLIAAMDWIARNHPPGTPGIINVSMTLRESQTGAAAMKALYQNGFPQFVSAGNAAVDACRELRALTHHFQFIVGSVTRSGTHADTSYGPCIDVFAPGVRALVPDAETGELTRKAGTSFSAPRVAALGVRALQADPSLTPDQLYTKLAQQARPGAVFNLGPESPNLLLDGQIAEWHYFTRFGFASQTTKTGSAPLPRTESVPSVSYR